MKQSFSLKKFPYKRALVFLIFLFMGVSCSLQKSQIITMQGYRETHIGMSEEALRKKFGDPFNTYVQDNGVMVYEYIERFQKLGPNQQLVLESRRYYFHIKDNKVVSKHMVIRDLPGYEPMNQV